MTKNSVFLLVALWGIGVSARAQAEEAARAILDATGVRGGLIVHVGCGDGRLTAALRASDSYLVQGLTRHAANVTRARETLHKLGAHGKVSVDLLAGGGLPYVDNLVNLVVAEDLGAILMAEVMRVLVPDGVAYVKRGGRWSKAVKPRPDDIDGWSHFLHDASNNAVAKDRRVGPPRRLQWRAGPPWCRSHEFISSFCAMVSADGRVFYVMDEGQPGVTDRRLPERWMLTARDAMNGVPLWKRPLPKWRADEWRGTSMRGRPPSVPRRIVAGRKRLYATLSHRAGLSVIDPATGKTLRAIDGTEGTQEIALVDDTLVLRLAKVTDKAGAIAAVDADTGTIRWRSRVDRCRSQSLAAAGGVVAYSTGSETFCLSLDDGRELWRSSGSAAKPEPKPSPKEQRKGKRKPRRRRSGDLTLILHGDLVIEGTGSSITARDARTGKGLWTARTGGKSMRGMDLFVTGGRVWHAGGNGIAGHDLKTGKMTKTINPSSVQSRGHHLRCYRAKATERYFITQFRGTEFVSLTDDKHSQNDWTRGACRYGVMPANGMLYTPPHQCFCYAGAMMSGLNAYVAAPDERLRSIGARGGEDRLRRGPAFGRMADRESRARGGDWPMYRHDARRTGATSSEVPVAVGTRWQVELAPTLTPPVAAGGRVYVAAKDRHEVHALDAEDGRTLWSYTAGGRIDSPPTVHRGSVLFGCADGRVYCLRASDGVLAWRFRAAPAERRIVSDGQVESVWRVHGSVPVVDGVVYCTAGRSSFLDGGIFLYGLDPRTGKIVHEGRLHTLMAKRDDAVGKPFLTSFHIQGTRSDLLVAEGGRIYINQFQFTPKLEQQPTRYVPHSPDEKTTGLDVAKVPYVAENSYLKKGFGPAAALGVRRGHMGDQEMGLHLFSTGGLLEDSWWNRTFWMYSKTWPGYQIGHIAPKAGQLLVIGDQTTYAVQAYPTRNVHSPMFTPAGKGYLLTADANDNEPMLDYRSWARDKGMGFTRKRAPRWHQWIPIRMRAMVLAGERLVVAGPPDVVPGDDPYAALDGRSGAKLRVVSATDGGKLAEIELDSPPVFDGMIAARGRLYLSTIDGKVMCLGGRR